MPDLVLQPRVWTDQLAKRLPRATEIVASAATIAHHINKPQRRTMALADKMKRLAERSTSVPKSLDAWADEHLAKFDALENRGKEAFSKLGTVMADVESGVSAAEDALNQLTNGGPAGPLPD